MKRIMPSTMFMRIRISLARLSTPAVYAIGQEDLSGKQVPVFLLDVGGDVDEGFDCFFDAIDSLRVGMAVVFFIFSSSTPV